MVNAGRPLKTISIYELSDYIDTLKTAGIPNPMWIWAWKTTYKLWKI